MIPVSFFDAHCDTLSCCTRFGWNLANSIGHVDIPRGREFDHYAQVFAIYHDPARAPLDGMYCEFARQAEMFRMQMHLNENEILHCKDAEDLERARREGKIAALLSVEGADLLECDPGRLAGAKELGVKMINLTWNRANALSGTNAEEKDRGLSAQGRAFVRRAGEVGILVDVSHLSDSGFWDLMDITQAPVVASHSNARALCDHPRNLTDEMFRAICQTGGFVGINFYSAFVGLDNSIDAVMAHIEHFLELGGEKTVGFGGDWDGCDALPGEMRGIQDMDRIYEAMLRRNYSETLIGDIFYHNLKRTIFER